MRGLESWLNGIWYGGKSPPFTLKILARLYALHFAMPETGQHR